MIKPDPVLDAFGVGHSRGSGGPVTTLPNSTPGRMKSDRSGRGGIWRSGFTLFELIVAVGAATRQDDQSLAASVGELQRNRCRGLRGGRGDRGRRRAARCSGGRAATIAILQDLAATGRDVRARNAASAVRAHSPACTWPTQCRSPGTSGCGGHGGLPLRGGHVRADLSRAGCA
jgi:hypothetical protein